ncbi:hypothetical protein, partial [Escherichia coli]|uniref:hypothetical protein n=1 Tax=Escherichia coli TaxID=562 RepID=UPI001BFC49DE
MDIRPLTDVTHLTFSRFISCCSGLNTSMPLQLPLKPALTIFMGTIRKLYRAQTTQAGIAQLVEHDLAKVGVAS